MRAGFILIAIVLSFFAARLVQLQGLDPAQYAEMAAAEGTVTVTLPAERGDILDRNGEPLAGSAEGLMVVADPAMAKKVEAMLEADFARSELEDLNKFANGGFLFRLKCRLAALMSPVQ